MIEIKNNICEKCTGQYCAKKVSIFSTLQNDQLKEIASMVVTRKYKKGQTIFFEGDVSDKLYIVNIGKIKVFKYSKEGKEQILYVLTNGNFIGELSLLKKSRLKFNAEALEDTIICTLTKEDFDKIIEKNPQITFKILESVHNRIVGLENLVQRLSTKDVESRVIDVLLSLAKDFGQKTEEGLVVDLPLSREEIGNYSGLTRETVSRTLTSMQDEGLIELYGNKKIIIKSIEELKNMT